MINKIQLVLLDYRIKITVIIVLSFSIQRVSICQSGSWKSIGPSGASYNSFIKYDSSSNRLYVLGNSTLFKSEDNGDTWIDISPDYLGNSYEYDLIIKDENPDEIYYLNIGRAMVFKSTDAGSSWEPFYSDSIRNVIFLDKRNPDILIALKPSGGWGNYFKTIQRSTNGGKEWQEITNGIDPDTGPIDAWVNPFFNNVILAKQTISYGGDVVIGELFYKSTNSGLSWSKMNLDSHLDLQKFIFDPIDDSIFYAKGYEKAWIKTTDGGSSWFEIGTNLPGEGSRNLLISPYDSDIFYMAFSAQLPEEVSDIFTSTNGGLEWTKFSTISPSQYISSILTAPLDHSELYVTSYPYGVFSSYNNGQNWSNISNGLNQTEVCSFSAGNSKIIYAGIANRGLFRTTDGGKSWETIHKNVSSCPGKILISKNNPNIIYTNDYMNGLRFSISENGGETWQSYPCSFNGLEIFDVADDNQTIFGDAFLGDIDGRLQSSIIKSNDGGISWKLLNLNIENINYIDKIEIDPYNKEIVYAIVAIRGSVSRNSLIRTTNGGENWSVISDTAANFFINYENSRYVYHCYGKSIYISENKGETFRSIFTGFDIKDIVFNKLKSGELFGITYKGSILKSEDYGYNWGMIDELQKDAGIQDLQICYSDSGYPILFGSTWYHGILKYELKDPLTSAELKQFNNINYKLSHNYPNPFNPLTNFEFDISQSGFVSLKILDVLGKEVAIIVNKELSVGKYKYQWDARGFASGIYFYTLKTGDFTQTKKMILLQ